MDETTRTRQILEPYAGRRHELGNAEAQGRGGQLEHRSAVRGLDRELDDDAVVRKTDSGKVAVDEPAGRLLAWEVGTAHSLLETVLTIATEVRIGPSPDPNR